MYVVICISIVCCTYVYVADIKYLILGITRMTTFMKAKLKKSDRQTNIEKYRVAVHKILQNIISEQKSEYEKLCLLHLISS